MIIYLKEEGTLARILSDSFLLSDLYCGHYGKYICSLKGRFDPHLCGSPIELAQLSCGCWIVLDGNNRVGLILKYNTEAKIGDCPKNTFVFLANSAFDEEEILNWNPYPKTFGYLLPISNKINRVIRNKRSFTNETEYRKALYRLTSLITKKKHQCLAPNKLKPDKLPK